MRGTLALLALLAGGCAPTVSTDLGGLTGQTVVVYVGPEAGDVCAGVLGLPGSPACSAWSLSPAQADAMIDAWREAAGAATCVVLLSRPEPSWLLHEMTLCATQGLGGAYWNKAPEPR